MRGIRQSAIMRAIFPDNYEPIHENAQWWLVEGDLEIAPGVELIRAPGHILDMMMVRLSGGGKTALFLADLVPTAAHLQYPWIMGFDLYPLTTLENKKKWLPEIVKHGWLAIFGHDPKMPAARLKQDERGHISGEPVVVD